MKNFITNNNSKNLKGRLIELIEKSDELKFLQSVKKSLNSEEFDIKEFYQQVRYFVKLINEDKLIIRKTYNPNHAKV